MAKILIAEDTPAMAELTREILKMGGHKVVIAEDGIEALRRMGVKQPEDDEPKLRGRDWKNATGDWTTEASQLVLPDLVLTDVQMPRMDGLTLATEMFCNPALKRIPVIVLTSKAKMEEPFKALSNVVGFIVKPPQPAPLLKAVEEGISRGVKT